MFRLFMGGGDPNMMSTGYQLQLKMYSYRRGGDPLMYHSVHYLRTHKHTSCHPKVQLQRKVIVQVYEGKLILGVACRTAVHAREHALAYSHSFIAQLQCTLASVRPAHNLL